MALVERREDQCVRFSEDKDSGSERVLEIVWNPSSEEFSFLTKLREGLLFTFTFYGKLLIQDRLHPGPPGRKRIACASMDRASMPQRPSTRLLAEARERNTILSRKSERVCNFTMLR